MYLNMLRILGILNRGNLLLLEEERDDPERIESDTEEDGENHETPKQRVL